jgi:hypothetical protein
MTTTRALALSCLLPLACVVEDEDRLEPADLLAEDIGPLVAPVDGFATQLPDPEPACSTHPNFDCWPLSATSCPAGQACDPNGTGGFGCFNDLSGVEGQAADPCHYINVCDPTLFCANPIVVPGCTDMIGCCSAFCIVGNGARCLPGQQCVPWFGPGEAPGPCWENLGACADI